jgi:hypothetical protein
VTTSFVTNTMNTYITNSLVTFTPTNTVTVTGVDVCQGRTAGAAANCQGLITPSSGPVISKPTMVNGAFSLTFPTTIGETYTLQYKNHLTDPAWTDLQAVAGTGGNETLTDLTAGTQPTRFYQVVVSP